MILLKKNRRLAALHTCISNPVAIFMRRTCTRFSNLFFVPHFLQFQFQESECEGLAGEQVCEKVGVETTSRTKNRFSLHAKSNLLFSEERSMKYELT